MLAIDCITSAEMISLQSKTSSKKNVCFLTILIRKKKREAHEPNFEYLRFVIKSLPKLVSKIILTFSLWNHDKIV